MVKASPRTYGYRPGTILRWIKASPRILWTVLYTAALILWTVLYTAASTARSLPSPPLPSPLPMDSWTLIYTVQMLCLPQPLHCANALPTSARETWDAEEAEAAACLDGVRLATCWSDVAMILESDSASVVAKLKSDGCDRSLIADFINDISMESQSLMELEVCKIGREQNAVAHALAQRACRL
ncbi:hypothetical protein EJB05_09481, partial [Eragrostis curvula]